MILVSLPKRKYSSVFESEIEEIKFGKFKFRVFQFVHAYDVERQNRSGFMLTNIDARELARQAGAWRATLYIRVKNSRGTWELSLPNTHLKQLEDDVTWFRHDGISVTKILKKVGNNSSWS